MLTDEKRKKLLAGALAVVMLTGVAGCGNDKDSEWKNDNSAQNNQDEKKDEDNGGDFFQASFPGTSSAVPFGVGRWQVCELRLQLTRSRILHPQARLLILNQTLIPPTALLCSRELQEARKIPSSAVREAQAKAASAVA